MKKNCILLLMLFCLSVSCKKDPGNQNVRFVPLFALGEDSIYYDSIDYTLINYSDLNELKDTSDLNNPNVFSNSIKLDILKDEINLAIDHTYVIKRFDMISKTGNILYYIPYGKNLGLPYSFKVHRDEAMIILYINRYPQ